MATQVRQLSSAEEFSAFVKDQICTVLWFWATFHEESKDGGQLDQLVGRLAALNPNLGFAKVDAEEVTELSERFEVAVVPTFLFMQGSNVVDKLEGANVSELAKRVDLFSKSVGTKRDAKQKAVATNGAAKKDLNERLSRLVRASPVMLFMKGTPSEPKCGFSRQTVELLNAAKVAFGSFNILSDEEVRQGLKEFSNWPTYPQLYVRGKLIGGLDILKEMNEEGNLKEQLGQDDMEEEVSLEDRLKELVNAAPVMLFMKGTPQEPRCGFSRKMVQLLRDHQVAFSAFDILSDEEVRQGLKEFSNWPTFPQLYVKGKLIGGLDIATEMAEEGDLANQLGLEPKGSSKQTEKKEDLAKLVNRGRVMLFMKGKDGAVGISDEQIVEILNEEGFQYDSFDILTDENVRQGLKEFSKWPTFPQLYVDGNLIGGLDIVKEMRDEGELQALKEPNENRTVLPS